MENKPVERILPLQQKERRRLGIAVLWTVGGNVFFALFWAYFWDTMRTPSLPKIVQIPKKLELRHLFQSPLSIADHKNDWVERDIVRVAVMAH